MHTSTTKMRSNTWLQIIYKSSTFNMLSNEYPIRISLIYLLVVQVRKYFRGVGQGRVRPRHTPEIIG